MACHHAGLGCGSGFSFASRPRGAGGQAAIRLLKQSRGRKDFFILNTDDIRQTITQTSQTLTLIVMIAVISLLGSSLTLVYSRTAIVLVVLCSTLIGIVFGYLPARNATNLDFAAALSWEWRH